LRHLQEINSYLDFVKAILILKEREIEEPWKKLSALELKNYYLGVDNETKTILEIFQDHNDKCKGLENKDYALGTIQRYVTTREHLKDFIKAKYKKRTIA